jgi:hypothetical protein
MYECMHDYISGVFYPSPDQREIQPPYLAMHSPFIYIHSHPPPENINPFPRPKIGLTYPSIGLHLLSPSHVHPWIPLSPSVISHLYTCIPIHIDSFLSCAESNCWKAGPPLHHPSHFSLTPLVTLTSATQSALYCAWRVKIDFACCLGQSVSADCREVIPQHRGRKVLPGSWKEELSKVGRFRCGSSGRTVRPWARVQCDQSNRQALSSCNKSTRLIASIHRAIVKQSAVFTEHNYHWNNPCSAFVGNWQQFIW